MVNCHCIQLVIFIDQAITVIGFRSIDHYSIQFHASLTTTNYLLLPCSIPFNRTRVNNLNQKCSQTMPMWLIGNQKLDFFAIENQNHVIHVPYTNFLKQSLYARTGTPYMCLCVLYASAVRSNQISWLRSKRFIETTREYIRSRNWAIWLHPKKMVWTTNTQLQNLSTCTHHILYER